MFRSLLGSSTVLVRCTPLPVLVRGICTSVSFPVSHRSARPAVTRYWILAGGVLMVVVDGTLSTLYSHPRSIGLSKVANGMGNKRPKVLAN